MNESRAIKDFMLAVGQDVPDTPRYPSLEVVKMRISIVEEEVTEFFTALFKIEAHLELAPKIGAIIPHETKLKTLVDLADAVADVIYVISGTATAFGIDAERVFEIVHAANMKKLDGPKREDGKQLKPPGWQPPEPEIEKLITDAWANAPTRPVEQRDGVWCEGPLDATTPS